MTPTALAYTTRAAGHTWSDVARVVTGKTTRNAQFQVTRWAYAHATAAHLPWPIPVKIARKATGPKPWKCSEIRIVRDGYAAGVPVDTIATTLGRSYRAITAAAKRLGIVHPNRKMHREAA